jgi:hypothetical protein
MERRKLKRDVPITYRPGEAAVLEEARFADFMVAQGWTPDRQSQMATLFLAKIRDLEKAHSASPRTSGGPRFTKTIPAGTVVEVVWAEEKLDPDQALLIQAGDGSVGPVLRKDTEPAG